MCMLFNQSLCKHAKQRCQSRTFFKYTHYFESFLFFSQSFSSLLSFSFIVLFALKFLFNFHNLQFYYIFATYLYISSFMLYFSVSYKYCSLSFSPSIFTTLPLSLNFPVHVLFHYLCQVFHHTCFLLFFFSFFFFLYLLPVSTFYIFF